MWLAHHGILGQKWGVRRYQNADGTLTAEGRLRYGYKKAKLTNDNGTLTEYGKYAYKEALKPDITDDKYIEDLDFLFVDNEKQYDSFKEKRDKVRNTGIIPKDMSLYRTTNYDEPLDANRKYAVINPTEFFANEYVTNPDVLSNNTDSSVIKYKAKRDLKIASDDEVKDFMYSLHNYEKLKSMDDGAKYITQNKRVTIYSNDDIANTNKYIKDALKYLDKIENLNVRLSSLELDLNGSYDQLSGYYEGKRYSTYNRVLDHFKKLGYDAIPDIEDGGLSSITAPVILLNPKESLLVDKRFKEDDWFKYYKDNYEKE